MYIIIYMQSDDDDDDDDAEGADYVDTGMQQQHVT